ncbi:FMN-binding negative transcriptional regulator [Sphingomonas sp. S-NIH.Pt15_0812]|uniref:FMN-binding negative transcriptional regulator n=1 Tax=Sphingomonas sp. S-NIH.Pt15_0812 TaxID=1920129 RepID=UPI000F7D68F8|nr:FMN-binding negative transcriptional regulator [Sphingomonas sp. S-NIH.Pt15_0812]RSU54549.1 hypothetical protein BRX43_00310 [Sphingomonas sp. S-NIH.Pt15_0812]
MYRPPVFRENRPDVLYEAIRAHPLGTLVTYGKSSPVYELTTRWIWLMRLPQGGAE